MSACCANGTCPECVAHLAALEASERVKAAAAEKAAPKKRATFFALGHRIPLEHSMLGLWSSRNARAAYVAITARRIGLIDDKGLLLRVYAIVVYGQAQNVMDEIVEISSAAEERAAKRILPAHQARIPYAATLAASAAEALP